jgi:cytochrome P450 family 142 subfamily A polypeptide 1
MTATDVQPAIDVCDPRFFDDPWDAFKWMQAQPGLYRDEANDLYVATRHRDVFHISRESETYCSKYGVRPKIAGDMSIITLDGEEHTRQRRLINKGFTPRRVRDLIPHVRELTNQLVDEIAERGDLNFVDEFAVHVPLIIICEMLGLDPGQREKMYRWSDDMMAGDGHTEADDPILLAAATSFGEYATMLIELIAERRANPADDLIGILTEAFDEGGLAKEFKAIQGVSDDDAAKVAEYSSLGDDELLAFLTVLLVAGNETTRNAITGGLIALSRFPEQRKLMLDNLDVDDFLDKAVDEIVRYVSPVLGFIRTVTHDHVYDGTSLKEGDRILLIYPAANRDAEIFDDADVLDLTRDPNPHLGFGIGPHFCLGANLARMELKTVFQELLTRLPDISVPADLVPKRADSTLVLALKDVPASFTKCPVNHAQLGSH